MSMPRRVKRRKQFHDSIAGKALRGNTISSGEYGLVALGSCQIKSDQIEATHVAMTCYIEHGSKAWVKTPPDKPVTVKSAKARIGPGKGALKCWAIVVKPGCVMFEIVGVPEETVREALCLAMRKLPCRYKIATKTNLGGGNNSEN